MLGTGRSWPITEVFRYRQLLISLIWRDISSRYRQSLIGIGWALLMPVAMMLIFTFVFTQGVKVVGSLQLSVPYALFAYTGLVPWVFFAACLTGAVHSLVANRTLVTKVYFPREVLPLASMGVALVDFLIASSLVVVLIAYFHFFTDWRFTLRPTALFMPVVLLIQLCLACGLGMFLAAVNLFFRDVRHVLGVVVQLWMFLTCVVYPIRNDGTWWGVLSVCNPMTPILQAYRDCLLGGRLPSGGAFVFAACLSVGTLIVGWTVFRRLSFKFAEHI
jgi:ABC-type polysaccharide/polyol phosphate export permease